MSDYPLLTIIVPTLNNEANLPLFFSYLKRQNYPKDKVEILCVDGGSNDKTADIAKANSARLINNPLVLAEPGISLGINNAHGDLIMILAPDNYFKNNHALQIITRVFSNKKILAAFPKHDSANFFSIFSKYHNRFTDPFNHFLYGDAANARTFYRVYAMMKSNKVYDVYDYSTNNLKPILALAQGFTIRTTYKKSRQDYFDDCKPVINLIEEGQQIAYIHSISVYHNTIRNLGHFLRKQQWATQNFLDNKNYGLSYRFDTLTWWQKIKMKIWPFYALTIIFPTTVALYGFVRDNEPLWLFHPVNCFLSASASLWQIIRYNLSKITKINRQ